jgi:hypothetical protein
MEYLIKHMNLDDVISKLGGSNIIDEKVSQKNKIQDAGVDYSSDENDK